MFIALSIKANSQTLEKYADGYKYGFKDKATKKIVIPAKYTSVLDFTDGINAVSESKLGSSNMVDEQKWKIIDTKGKEISSEEFDLIQIKKNGLAFVYKLNKTEDNPSGYSFGKAIYKIGIMKKDGTYLLPCELDNISEMGKDYYKIFSKDSGAGVVSVKGNIIIARQLKFDVKEYIGCDLFSYTNQDPMRKAAVGNGAIGGILDSKLNILMNQDSIDFCPSLILNSKDCSNKKNLFGITGGKASNKGIYRVGFGLVVPISYKLSAGNGGGFHTYEIKPNVIEIYETIRKKLIAKYDWNGKLIFSIEK